MLGRRSPGVNRRPMSSSCLNLSPFHGAIRMGKWKLVHNGQAAANVITAVGEENWELFDLDSDPYEQSNLCEERPEVFERLKRKLAELVGEEIAPRITLNSAPADFKVPKVWGASRSLVCCGKCSRCYFFVPR